MKLFKNIVGGGKILFRKSSQPDSRKEVRFNI